MDYRGWIIAFLMLAVGIGGGFILGERVGNPAELYQEVIVFEADDKWDITANGPIFQAPRIVKPDPAEEVKP